MKKKLNIVYPIVLLCVVAVTLILSIKTGNEEKESEIASKNNDTASNTLAVEDSTYSSEEKDTINEAKNILANGKQNENLKGKYEDRPHSIMVNPKNITDEYVFFDPVRLVNYEFISYEELGDLSQYETSIDPNDIQQCVSA